MNVTEFATSSFVPAPSSPNGDHLATPVAQKARIASIDVLRGLAVFGILVMNIQSFSMIDAAYMNPTAFGDLTGANYGIWLVSHVLADQKFMTIFSMLFGAGVVLMTGRREAEGRRSAGLHYRRMAVLLLFGILHAYLLWFGDILYTYAMCGMIVYLLRHRRPRTLLIVGLMSIAVGSAVTMLFGLSLPHWPAESRQEMMAEWAPTPEEVADNLETYRGRWWQQMECRAPSALGFQTFLFLALFVWRAGGLMLVGMALFKLDVFSAKRSIGFYAAWITAAVCVGIPVILYGVHRNFAANWDMSYSFFLGGEFNYWASILVSMGWISLVMLICKKGVRWITAPLAAAGQMALTNYLLQTIICTTIFYGHGFGLYGRMERVAQAGMVVGVWLVELALSTIWMRHFLFGPFEWLWRSLTYMQRQPFLRRPAAHEV